MTSPSTPISSLRNLGTKCAKRLATIDIHTLADLQAADLVNVWITLKMRDPSTSIIMYYALWGALHNVPWNKVPAEVKQKIATVAAEFR